MESQLAAATGSQQPPPQRRGGCWEFMGKGTCSRGKDCRFSHEKADIDEERRKQKGKGKGGDVNAFTPKGGKSKGRGRGRGRKGDKGGGGGGGQPSPPKEQKDKLCPSIKRGEQCPYGGEKCKFSHKRSKFDEDGKLKSGSKGRGGGGSSKGKKGKGEWAPPPGMARGGKKGGQGRMMNLATAPDAGSDSWMIGGWAFPMGVYGNSLGIKQPTEWTTAHDHDRGKGTAGYGKEVLHRLEDLPASWWTQCPNDEGGYNYRTFSHIVSVPVETLLDGGAGVNSVTEEIVCGAINEAHQKEIWSDDPRYPVLQLEWWPRNEMVTGIVRGARVRVIGAAVLRVQMTELNKAAGPVLLFRCKIFERGSSDWHGLILGGRALDCVEMGGLGFHPTAGGHAFTALGILMQRIEVR
ncbi:MAG: hypothetical protein VYC95_05695, partial [Verrucomicrobiota bacterium]|nr:hypothetical protein [Verrucomicrobiota bacterium]